MLQRIGVVYHAHQISGNSIWDVSGTRRCSFPDANFRKIHLECKWNTLFWFSRSKIPEIPIGKLLEQAILVLPDGNYTE